MGGRSAMLYGNLWRSTNQPIYTRNLVSWLSGKSLKYCHLIVTKVPLNANRLVILGANDCIFSYSRTKGKPRSNTFSVRKNATGNKTKYSRVRLCNVRVHCAPPPRSLKKNCLLASFCQKLSIFVRATWSIRAREVGSVSLGNYVRICSNIQR